MLAWKGGNIGGSSTRPEFELRARHRIMGGIGIGGVKSLPQISRRVVWEEGKAITTALPWAVAEWGGGVVGSSW